MSVAGTYDIVTKTPMGDQRGKLTIEVDGDRLSGTVFNDMGSMDIRDGSVTGNMLSWKMNMTSPMPMTLEARAIVNGDAITGSVKAGAFGSMELSGTRAG